MLLDEGADVNTQGGVHGNALQAAWVEGHEKIVDVLVNTKAKISAQDADTTGMLSKLPVLKATRTP
jgi:hypothetical protein